MRHRLHDFLSCDAHLSAPGPVAYGAYGVRFASLQFVAELGEACKHANLELTRFGRTVD